MAVANVQLPEPTSTAPTAQLHDANSEEHSPSTFVLFPKLPPELRIKIWRLTIPTDRVVKILAGGYALDPPDSYVDKEGNTDGRHCFKTRSTETIPILLHINRESRAEGLRIYELCLGTRFLYPVYFNFVNDAIHLLHQGDL